MAQQINWISPINNNVGSVLVYRADTTLLDSLGSRSLITTVAAKDSNGSWVNNYVDSGGVADSIYRIQFWDGIGSSELSDPIGREYSEQLASYEDVIRAARIQNYQEIGSDIVYYAISDATDSVFFEFGDPIKKTAFFVDSETGVSGQAYDFTGDMGPVFQVREVFVNSVEPEIVSNSYYQVNYGNGVIKFTDEFIGSYQGKYVMVDWVPSIYNVLIKNMAALDILEGELIATGAGNITNTRVDGIQKKIDEAKEFIRPKGLFSTKSWDYLNGEYVVIPQYTKRNHIYFSN